MWLKYGQKISYWFISLFLLIALVQFAYNLVHFKLHNGSVLLGHFFSKLRAYVKCEPPPSANNIV